jgi:hypothetical protein
MNVKTSRAQSSRPTMSRYAEEIATSLDPNHARGRFNQSLVDQRIEDHRDVVRQTAFYCSAGSFLQLGDAGRSWFGEHGPQHGTAQLASAADVTG